MDRVRDRVKDKRVLGLVKAFLKAGVLTEDHGPQETFTGTPQGGILSPLLANIALSVLDEHLTGPWKPGGAMPAPGRRACAEGKDSRAGGSSATRTTSWCSWMAADLMSPPCTRKSLPCSHRWASGCHQLRPGSCT